MNIDRIGSLARPAFLFITILLLAFSAMIPLEAQSYTGNGDFIEVYGVQREDNGYDFYASNEHFIPVYINVSFLELVSLAPNVDLPWRGAIPPETEEQYLFSLQPTATRGQLGYNLVYSFAEGDPESAHHDDDHLYLFPFEHGTKHRVTQGHDGQFSHFGENRYAIDFDLEEGTPVYAAREGVVVRVKEDSTVGGPSQSYAAYGNAIMIAHEDGSFGNYVHLRYRGAEVEVGDYVEAGQLIGYSGNTGVTSGPHLHFDVRLPQLDGTMQSIPVRFAGVDGEAVEPAEGEFYYAVHPGLPPFEQVYGADLTVEDFADHTATIATTRRIEFRAEQHDLSYAIFVGNGFENAVDATIDFQLVGMRAEGRLPIELRIPAGTEVFVTLLRADGQAHRWQYSPTVRYRQVEE